MLQYIKQVTKNFFNPFGKLYWPDESPDEFVLVNGGIHEGAFFTQAELQYLKQILAERINEEEFLRSSVLGAAKVYQQAGDPRSKQFFKKHRKTKAKLKKLTKIQQKVKHSLVTMG